MNEMEKKKLTNYITKKSLFPIGILVPLLNNIDRTNRTGGIISFRGRIIIVMILQQQACGL